MSLPIVTAADGGAWEAMLLGQLTGPGAPLSVVRRCVDAVELAAVAASGQAVAVLVGARIRRLDADLVHRIAATGVAVVGVLGEDEQADTEWLRGVGISFAVATGAGPAVFADVVRDAVAGLAGDLSAANAFADPMAGPAGAPGAVAGGVGGAGAERRDPLPGDGSDWGSGETGGKLIAVWGPAGAPGRTTVAVHLADEIARLGSPCVLVDADVYGGVVANALGLLDESPGLIAACRQAQARRLDREALAALCWQLSPGLRVLTGLARADRWPEVRPAALQEVLALCRGMAECTVLDLGFCLETDEELSFDTIAPRRNGATLAALEAADLVLVVGSADPVGMQRLIRGLDELHALQVPGSVWVAINKVRAGSVPGKPEAELDAALRRFAGRSSSAFLPHDQAALDRALLAGKTLGEVAANSPLRNALQELAAAVSGRPVPERSRHRVSLARRA